MRVKYPAPIPRSLFGSKSVEVCVRDRDCNGTASSKSAHD